MKVINLVQSLVSSKVDSLRTFFALVKLEIRLAELSIFPLIINICFILLVLLTMWILALLLLGYGLSLLITNIAVVMALLFILNIIGLIILIMYLKYNLKCMSFEKTREYLFEENSHE